VQVTSLLAFSFLAGVDDARAYPMKSIRLRMQDIIRKFFRIDEI
jgi:hypothetical protein